MNYLSSMEAAKVMGITVRRVQQMCKQGEISGAVKKGHSWLIPENAVWSDSGEKKKPLPIGISDFKTATTSYYYVDKTLLIRDFLDTKPMVSLFTRPRRFGKTLNMDMVRVFFEKTQEDTSIYFKDKQIWQCGSDYTRHQGKYPVIFLTFKDVKCLTWQETFQKIRKLISLEFIRHSELEESTALGIYEKEQYHRLASDNANEVDCQMGLQILSLLLHKHYGQECIIIIDEYDTPIQQQLNDEELKAIMDTAHALGKTVTAHVYTNELMQKLIAFGIDGMEHGSLMNRETAQLIEDEGLYLVPTFCPYEEAVHYDPEEMKKKQPEFRRKLELYKNALQAGREVICSSKIKLGYGTDFVANHQNYESGYEYEAWLNSGMNPFAALKAATSVNADILQLSDKIGTIEPGKYADISAWKRDLMHDTKALLDCAFVMKDGKVYETESCLN